MQRRRCRKNRTAAARHPYLGGNERAAARVLVRQHLVKKGRDAAPSGSQVSGADAPFLGCEGGVAAQVGRRRRAIPTLENERATARVLVRQHLVKKW